MMKSAVVSEDNNYRYQLSRIWDESKPAVLFVMLNPSTADAFIDDPTIRRCINFARYWGYGGLYVGNLYAYRSTDPKALKHIDNPVGDDNIAHIQSLVTLVDKVIYAWGNNQKEPEWLRSIIETPYCIELSNKGVPKHPLYLKGDLQPKLFMKN